MGHLLNLTNILRHYGAQTSQIGLCLVVDTIATRYSSVTLERSVRDSHLYQSNGEDTISTLFQHHLILPSQGAMDDYNRSQRDGDAPEELNGLFQHQHDRVTTLQNMLAERLPPRPWLGMMPPTANATASRSPKRGIGDNASLLLLLDAKRRRLQEQLAYLEERAQMVQVRLVSRGGSSIRRPRSSAWYLEEEEETWKRPAAVEKASMQGASRAPLEYSLYRDAAAKTDAETAALLQLNRLRNPSVLSRLTSKMAERNMGHSTSERLRDLSSDSFRTPAFDAATAFGVSNRSSRKNRGVVLPSSTSHPKDQQPSLLTASRSSIEPEEHSVAIAASPVPSEMPMSLRADAKYLSPYQALIRKALEFFVATEQDINTSQKGRKRKVRLHQIGIRCRYCAHLHPSIRTRGAVTYPRNRSSFYLCAQNIIMAHLVPTPAEYGGGKQYHPCHCLPATMIQALAEAKAKQSASAVGSGYWAKEGCVYDFVERDGAVWLAEDDNEDDSSSSASSIKEE